MADARERLKHGKALCGKVFRNFVETFNWLVDFSSNIKGDGDAGGSGKIVVDRKDDSHPVIRCKGCSSSGSGSSVSLIGTDGSTATAVGTITFASASDANVEVHVAEDGNGNATATIGVYYK